MVGQMSRTIELVPGPCEPGTADFTQQAFVTGRCRHGFKWYQYVVIPKNTTEKELEQIRDTTPPLECSIRFYK